MWGTGMGTCMSMQKLAVTKEGYMAILPTMAKVGDTVLIICGRRYPLVLRRKGGGAYERVGGTCYELMGESYVHGIMDGEMMNVDTEVRKILMT